MYIERSFKYKNVARTTIKVLQKLYDFHVDNYKYEKFQRAQAYFEDLQKVNEQLLALIEN